MYNLLLVLLASKLMIAGISVVVLIVLAVVYSMYNSGKRKANAGANLEKIKQLHAAGNLNDAIKLLSESFYNPMSEKYTAEEAGIAYQMIVEADAIFKDMNIDAASIIMPAEDAFGKIKNTGGKVNTDDYPSFIKLLDEIELNSDEQTVLMIVAGIKGGGLSITPGAISEEIGGEKSGAYTDVINKVGKCMLKGNLDEALTLLNDAIPTATLNGDKADLLNQRGGVYFMKKDYEAAIKDYAESVTLEPGITTHKTNLAETLDKAGQKEKAREMANAILNSNVKIDKYDRKKLEDIARV
jgi:tetratricopeptide (TPR) repeat protein